MGAIAFAGNAIAPMGRSYKTSVIPAKAGMTGTGGVA
jgi:hypothetical protein